MFKYALFVVCVAWLIHLSVEDTSAPWCQPCSHVAADLSDISTEDYIKLIDLTNKEAKTTVKELKKELRHAGIHKKLMKEFPKIPNQRLIKKNQVAVEPDNIRTNKTLNSVYQIQSFLRSISAHLSVSLSADHPDTHEIFERPGIITKQTLEKHVDNVQKLLCLIYQIIKAHNEGTQDDNCGGELVTSYYHHLGKSRKHRNSRVWTLLTYSKKVHTYVAKFTKVLSKLVRKKSRKSNTNRRG